MNVAGPGPVESHRRDLSEDQRKLIDAIWEEFARSPGSDWPLVRDVRMKVGRSAALAAANGLPPGTILGTQAGHRYTLSLYGAFLSSQGDRLFEIFVTFLQYVKTPAGHMTGKIKAAAVREALGLSIEETTLIPKLISLSWIRVGLMRSGPEWECDLPENLDELVELPDLAEYVERESRRTASAAATMWQQPIQSDDPLGFVSDPMLRIQLTDDLAEMSLAHRVGARKSTVILAGGILEGVLVNALRGMPEDRVRDAAGRSGHRADSVDSWSLSSLVDVASKLDVLPGGLIQLSHGLREFRNLVHPGRQMRERIVLSEDEAEIAVRIVQLVLRTLSRPLA